jgi:hypothetical protein
MTGGAGGGYVFDPSQYIRITNTDDGLCGAIRSDCDPQAVAKGHGQLVPPDVARWKGKSAIVGKFAGKWYVFPKDQPVDVHVDVARHIFGLGVEDKSAALQRLGWMRTSEQMDEALERLRKIKFDDLPQMMAVPESSHASGLVKGDNAEGGATPPEAVTEAVRKGLKR